MWAGCDHSDTHTGGWRAELAQCPPRALEPEFSAAQGDALSPTPGPPARPLTRPEDGQGAVLVQPGQCRPVQLFQATGGHHPLEGLEQWLDDDTELHGMWVKEKVERGGGGRPPWDQQATADDGDRTWAR